MLELMKMKRLGKRLDMIAGEFTSEEVKTDEATSDDVKREEVKKDEVTSEKIGMMNLK